MILRYEDGEAIFDSSKTLINDVSIEWAAWKTGVESQIMPVKAGYKIILEYDLHYEKRKPNILENDPELTASPYSERLL